ncbi:MAG: hypothetical protein OXG71_12450 [Rhodospirillales bacterium]|nr:hypothetical protein [Rhodospirillales bacterium]
MPAGQQRRPQIRCTVQEFGSTAVRINLETREQQYSLLSYGLERIGHKLAGTGAASRRRHSACFGQPCRHGQRRNRRTPSQA